MTIIYKQGDVLSGPEKYILHGCNAQGVMGSGIAKAIRSKWPEVYDRYHEAYQARRLSLGSVVPIVVGGKTVFNCITQKYYGRDKNIVYVDYKAVESCMNIVSDILKDEQGACVAMPLIGCGLANGDWNIVEAIIDKAAQHWTAVVYRM